MSGQIPGCSTIPRECRRHRARAMEPTTGFEPRSEEHTSELQSRENLVCRLLLRPPPLSTSFPYPTLFRSRSNFAFDIGTLLISLSPVPATGTGAPQAPYI